MIRHCHGLVAVVDPGTFTAGTVLEIAHARDLCKPLVIVGDINVPWAFHDVAVFPTIEIEDAIQHLIGQIQNGAAPDGE
jgi:hypothetical protein